MRQVNSRLSVPDVYTRYERLKRRTAAAAALLLLARRRRLPGFHGAAAGDGLDVRVEGAARGADARHRRQLQRHDRVGRQQRRRRRLGRARRDLGLPALHECSPGRRQVHQAMVGPYASLDEAERAQRRLTGLGFAGARIFVDESLRNAPRSDLQVDAAETNPDCCSSVRPTVCRWCSSCSSSRVRCDRAAAENDLDIDAGPMATPCERAAVECARRRPPARPRLD